MENKNIHRISFQVTHSGVEHLLSKVEINSSAPTYSNLKSSELDIIWNSDCIINTTTSFNGKSLVLLLENFLLECSIEDSDCNEVATGELFVKVLDFTVSHEGKIFISEETFITPIHVDIDLINDEILVTWGQDEIL